MNKKINNITSQYRNIVTLILVVSIMNMMGCSDEKTSAPADNKVAATAAPQPEQIRDISIAPGTYRVIENFNVGDNIYVRSMIIDKQSQSLWVGTSIGVLEVDTQTRDLRNTFTRKEGLANEYVFGMLVAQDNAKWFGTNGGGMSRYLKGDWKTYFPMHGLADYWVYSFTQQKSGIIWVGTWAGLTRFDEKTGEMKTFVKELVNEWVYGLDGDSKDNVWIGNEGGVNMYDGKTWAVWTHKDGLGATNNENLPVSDNTGLGTRSRHDLSVMDQGTMTYNPNYVFSLLVADDDTVWAGTWGGGVSHFDGKTWTNYTVKDGLAGNIVYTVAQGPDGIMWFGTSGGLTRYDGKQWSKITRKDGLTDNHIYAIAPTEDGQVWAGSKSAVMLLAKHQ